MTGAAIGLVAGLMVSSTGAAPQAEVSGLAVEYANGRRTVSPIPPSGSDSWTVTFPRIAGADTARDGLPLSALQLQESWERDGLAVTVALLYGSIHERRVPVATIHLTGATPQRVGALEAFGVQPIALALVPLPSGELRRPSITTSSSKLEVTAAGAAA